MTNQLQSFPATIYGYWRPWKEDANYWHDYLDFVRDGSLVKYGADTVGKYINQASKEQVQAINQLGQKFSSGINLLSNQLSSINNEITNVNKQLNLTNKSLDSISTELTFLNRKFDIIIEQQNITNLLLKDIIKVLQIPDSEKERQQCIKLGLKFFTSAQKDSDLYADALDEFLKAEYLMKQDYFVLHKIGYIYLYVEEHLDPNKALDYFLRSAKYASLENNVFAAESYEKAAFISYVLGSFDKAISYQSKAFNLNSLPKYQFNLAKYNIRSGNISEGVFHLSNAIDNSNILFNATFNDLDLLNEMEVHNLLNQKSNEADNLILDLKKKLNIEDQILPQNYIDKHSFIKSHSIYHFELDLGRVFKIGSQIWMTDNLSVSNFRNGDQILEAKSQYEWIDALLNKKPSFCYYNFDPIYKTDYGKLYNCFAFLDNRNIAPLGWRIPCIKDFEELFRIGFNINCTVRHDLFSGHLTKDDIYNLNLYFNLKNSGYLNCGNLSLDKSPLKFEFSKKYRRYWINNEVQQYDFKLDKKIYFGTFSIQLQTINHFEANRNKNILIDESVPLLNEYNGSLRWQINPDAYSIRCIK